jgi:hypothetical protein
VVFEPVCVGECRYKAEDRDRQKMDLPLEPEPYPEVSDRFEYTNINSEAGEIRLLHVKEAVFLSDPLQIEMISVKLDDPEMPKFAALSYHWGAAVFEHTLICDGKLININESLRNVLKRQQQNQFPKKAYFL